MADCAEVKRNLPVVVDCTALMLEIQYVKEYSYALYKRNIKEKQNMEAAELGIDLTMIKVCRRFRHLAKLDRLRIDMTEHRSGLNKHLFGYIEYCGMTSLDFVRQYQ